MRIAPRLALLAGAAIAASFVGMAGARAEMIYVTEPGYVAAPGYAYTTSPPGYVVTEAPQTIYVEPRSSYVVEPSPSYVVVEPPAATIAPPMPIAPRQVYAPRARPRESGIVTTGFTTERRCFVDLAGFERCY